MKAYQSKLIPLISVVGFFVVCQILFSIGVRVEALPSPLDILHALGRLFIDDNVMTDIIASLGRILGGYIMAIIAGVSIGLLFAWKPFLQRIINPLIEIARPIPPIAWIPFAIIVFGLGNYSAIFIVFLGAFFPIFTNTYSSANNLSRTLRNTCRCYDIRGVAYVKNVLFFQALPGIISGMRIGVGMAWMSVIAAELVGAQNGLGYLIQNNRLLLRTDYVMAGMLLIGIVGLLLNGLVTLAERKSITWLGLNK